MATLTLPQTVAVMRRWQEELDSPLQPLMLAIGEALADSTSRRFQSETDPLGRRWANLQPATLARKTNRNGGIRGSGGGSFRAILKDRGHLAESFSTNRHILTAHRQVSIGTSQSYGKYHQFGTQHLPKRAFLGISAEDEQTIGELVADYFQPPLL